MTMSFERACIDPDEIIDRICTMHNQGYAPVRRVHCCTDPPGTIEEVPYSQRYASPPHFILAGKTGWMKLPARADYFTGQNSVVMRARRKDVSKTMRSKDSNNHRMKTIEMANADLFRSQKMDIDNSISPDTRMKPCGDMDVDMGKVCATRTPPVNTIRQECWSEEGKETGDCRQCCSIRCTYISEATMWRQCIGPCQPDATI